MKMFQRFIITLLLIIPFLAHAQSTTITPGTVLPQMTTAQRTALSNPVNGMLVFDTNTSSYWFRQGSNWAELTQSGSTANYWELNGVEGNEIKNTNSGGFWSDNPIGLTSASSTSLHPPTAPINGNGTRLMWIPSRSAFRVGSVSFHTRSWDADSIGLFSFATGYNTKAKAKYSTAMGRSTTASNLYTTAFGSLTKATGLSSTAMGTQTIASGTVSTAMGGNTIAKARYSLVLGSYNDDNDNPFPNASGSHDRIFQIGNGSSSSNRSNAVTVLRNGSVGIGELTPNAKLHVDGYTKLGGEAPALKAAEITGSTASTLNGCTTINLTTLGFNADKIVSYEVMVVASPGNYIKENYTRTSGVEFTTYTLPNSIEVCNHSSNSYIILSKPIKGIIWYKP